MEIKKIITKSKNLRKYKIVESYIAGMVLNGNEIKSLRNNQVSISEAFVLPYKNELYIINMNISSYRHAYVVNESIQDNEPNRRKKLLLKKKEIKKIIKQTKSNNYVIIPLKVFLSKNGWAKMEIALAQHLKIYQLKLKIKEKDIKKKLQRKEFDE